ncbi:g4999 [Coccomyxa viridis]|uniref:G4999 protein n=1 Tax=Coccomyxa viridis TaxID=1274662 RepID=A0ABP1FUA5_9CHLO
MIAEMQELPDDILLLIARQVLDKEEGLRLWGKLSSACRRLWSFRLPSEPTYFLNDRLTDQGKIWALERIQQACKLNLAVSARSDGQHDVLWDGAGAMMQASGGLTRLETLVLSDSGNASSMQLCDPLVQMLLLGAGSLTALSIHLRTIPRSPILQHLHLRHLEVVVSSST